MPRPEIAPPVTSPATAHRVTRAIGQAILKRWLDSPPPFSLADGRCPATSQDSSAYNEVV